MNDMKFTELILLYKNLYLNMIDYTYTNVTT